MAHDLRTTLGLASWALAVGTAVAVAQERPQTARERQLYMTRAELVALVDFYDRSEASPAYSPRLRERAAFLGGVVQDRLTEGDFQVGDRVVVTLEGATPTSDTLAVGQEKKLHFPELGDVPLAGVLRSELQGVLAEYLGSYVRDPQLVAQALIRIQLSGSVGAPGFYTMPSEVPLPDAIMLAGGPAGNVDLGAIRIERRGRTIISGDRIQDALAAGQTLDQLGLQGGDHIVVPQQFPLGAAESALRTFGYLLAIPFSIAALIALVT